MNMGEIFAGAIIIAVIGAATVIAIGYYSFFFAFFPDNQVFAAVATMIVFACIVMFIRNSGHEFFGFTNMGRDKRAIGPFLLWYLLLFLLSATGVIRFAMFYFEGPDIAREKTDESLSNYSNFGANLNKIFDSAEWASFDKGARAQFGQIVSEMDNQINGYCGVGATARQEIDALHSILPGFGYLNGSSDPNILSCRDKAGLGRIISQYKTLFENALKQSPKRADLRVDDRSNDKQIVQKMIDKNYEALEDIKQRLNKAVTFIFDTSLFSSALDVLQRANDDYEKMYDMGSQFADMASVGVQKAPSIETLRQLQSSTGVFSVVFQRMFHSGSRSLIFFVLALGVDFLLVLLASVGYRLSRARLPMLQLSNQFVSDSDVRYLWVPPQERTRRVRSR